MNRIWHEKSRGHAKEGRRVRSRDWREVEEEGEEGCDVDIGEHPNEPTEISGDWPYSLHEAIGKLLNAVEDRKRKVIQLEALADGVRELRVQLAAMETCHAFTVSITTLAPEPYDLLREIKVVVQASDDEYTATFFDANVNASGCNQVEAVENLKDIILSRFDYLDRRSPDKLGPALARQLTVLRQFLRRKE